MTLAYIKRFKEYWITISVRYVALIIDLLYFLLFLRCFKLVGLDDAKTWNTDLLNLSFSQTANQCDTLSKIVSKYHHMDEIPLDLQFEVLSCIPNTHNWVYKKKSGVKMFNYFWSHGISPRNLILQNFDETLKNEDSFHYVKRILLLTILEKYKIEYIPARVSKNDSKVNLIIKT